MAVRSFRPVFAVALATLLVGGVLAPAVADGPPPPDWQPHSSVVVDDAAVSWQTATSTFSPFGGPEVLDEMPIYRPDVVNGSNRTRYFALGTDLVTPGVIDEIWMPEGWGAFGDAAEDVGLAGEFWYELLPGQSMVGTGRFADGLPAWSGHTITIFELESAPEPAPAAAPAATPLLSITTPGRHVPADLGGGDLDNISAAMGQRATVSGSGPIPEVFAGVTATVTASDLPLGEQLELWITQDTSYAFVQIFGGGLAVDSIKVGEGTVAPDGSLAATFTVPPGTADGIYQLLAGVRAERYWPAGTYDDFEVSQPSTVLSAASPANPTEPVAIPVDQSKNVSLTFPTGASAGETTVIPSSTGPLPTGFQLTSDPPLYLHIDSTVEFDGAVTVCFAYDRDQFATPPHIYHFHPVLFQWQQITTSRTPGVVCGTTSSFSPFVLAIPDAFPFSGFLAPVADGEPNLAKAGQAIPVKFSLGGDRGLEVLVSARFRDEGTVLNPTGEWVDAAAAGNSGLSYDPSTDTYTYVWKTSKAWAQHTGQFVMELSDGSTHTFDVSFRK
jgi:hypothetical protein